MIRYPIGISTFRELMTGNYIFVDKTLFLKDFIEEGSKVSLITRPRRFGKTLTLSMCEEFFDIENSEKDNIFANLKISEHKDLCEEYQNKYPVIFISFKDVKEPNYKKAIEQIKILLMGLYKSYDNLLEENFLKGDEKEYFRSIINREASEEDMKISIKYLARLLHKKYNKKIILLIDEYDTPIQAAYLRGYYQDMVDFMRGFFGTSLKEMGQGKAIF